jgi:CIC family chloride channel protein
MPAVPMLPASLWMGIAVGLLCGGLGWVLLVLLERSRTAFGRIALVPARLAIGGTLVGLISAAVPEVWGNGYSVVSRILVGDSDWTWVALILIAKISATLLSAGSGAIGGVFTPMLFVGATSCYVIAHLAGLAAPFLAADPRATAVIGMAAALAAVTQAPLMAIVMVLEMTHQFQLTIPVMLSCGIAYAISSHSRVDPLYGNPIEGH